MYALFGSSCESVYINVFALVASFAGFLVLRKDRQVSLLLPFPIASSYHGLMGLGNQLLLSFPSNLSGLN